MHASLIAVGKYPEDIEGWADDDINRQAPGYIAVRTALCGAIESKAIPATKEVRDSGEFQRDDDPLDVRRTTISVAVLDQFFKARGFQCALFEREVANRNESSGNPFSSKKLAAANKAWAAVTANPSLLIGKSPKQALEKWLSENAADLHLLNRDGTVNRTGIEEICKVANWKPSGGATPTPSVIKPLPSSPLVQLPMPGAKYVGPLKTYDLNDDIPF